MAQSDDKARIFRRYTKAYLSAVGVAGAFVLVSEMRGAGWRPALAGTPLYATLFLGITYQLVKDVRQYKRKR
jgi:hypothetical protein